MRVCMFVCLSVCACVCVCVYDALLLVIALVGWYLYVCESVVSVCVGVRVGV